MEIETLKVGGKIGQLYFSYCPNCKKTIVHAKDNIVMCSDCKKKHKIQYPE